MKIDRLTEGESKIDATAWARQLIMCRGWGKEIPNAIKVIGDLVVWIEPIARDFHDDNIGADVEASYYSLMVDNCKVLTDTILKETDIPPKPAQLPAFCSWPVAQQYQMLRYVIDKAGRAHGQVGMFDTLVTLVDFGEGGLGARPEYDRMWYDARYILMITNETDRGRTTTYR